MGRPVRIRWLKRRWLCSERTCRVGSFVEQDEMVAAPRARLTTRACWWAIEQIRREHASVNGLRRQLGTGWRTVWEAIKPLLEAADADVTRFAGVAILGVDEHVWHHVSTSPVEAGGRGPKELTGMVDLTRDTNGHTRPGCSTWFPAGPARRTAAGCDSGVRRSRLASRSPPWTRSMGTRTRSTISCRTPGRCWTPSTSSSSPLRSWTTCDVGCSRTPPATAAARDDPLYRVRNLLRIAGEENLTDRQQARLDAAFTAREEHLEIELAWRCAQQVRSCYHQPTHAAGRQVAEKIIAAFPSCPIPEIRRLGKTLRRWKSAFLAYFDTDGASNRGTEAINGLIELHRRIARGFRNRDNYRLRMLLIAGGLDL